MTVVFLRDPVKAGLTDEEQEDLELQPESQPESRPESDLGKKILFALEKTPMGKANLAASLGHATVSGELNKQVRILLQKGLIEWTIPEKPTGRLQQYRLTEEGYKLRSIVVDDNE